MRIKQLLYAQELKAVACCGQSDGYLASWAVKKISKMADRQSKLIAAREARDKAGKN
jgi:hypothetical protein